MENKNKAVTVLLSAALAAGCVPAVALAQAAVSDQIPTSAEQQVSLHERILAGDVIKPEGKLVGWAKDISKAAPDGWQPCAYAKNGKVYMEIAGRVTSAKYFWTMDEITEIDPDIVITKDYENNVTTITEGDFYTFTLNPSYSCPLLAKNIKSIKYDCITPGTLDGSVNCEFYYTKTIDEFGTFKTCNSHVDSEGCDTIIIGKNVKKLKDGWAQRTVKHYVFEKGSKLESVGKANIDDSDPWCETIEGLPSGAKLKDGALAFSNLEKVTKPSGADYKVPESALKSSFTTAPLSKSYWPGALAKARSITMSATVKKGGKSSFAKTRGLKYTKTKVSKLKAGKYKKAAKKQAAKVTVSKAGKVTVAKGLKKGTYKIKTKASVAGHAKTVTATVKVK